MESFLTAQAQMRLWHDRHSVPTPGCPWCDVERLQSITDNCVAALSQAHDYPSLRDAVSAALEGDDAEL